MMRITTLPVYSRLAQESEIPVLVKRRLPAGWRLSQHQINTYSALTRDDVDVVINTAMTGDGKSLAAQLRSLVDLKPLLLMYPTNELARDQEMQVSRNLDLWQRDGMLSAQTMTGNRLADIVRSGEFARKADALKSMAANNEILLTNPDIFHYTAQFFYTRKEDAPDAVFGRAILDLFDVFVFDEFHIFLAPQVVSVLNAMLLIREMATSGQPKKFLFLSATPGNLLNGYLSKADFRTTLIEPAEQGQYLHSYEVPDAQNWRPIIRDSTIYFWPPGAEAWADAHWEDTLLAFFKAHGPAAKGAFIVNSVAVAHRLVEWLQPRFAEEGLHVLPNTGLTPPQVRRASRDADLLIGTSTVDVGVDFRINFLIFESRDAGTFLQRLGRLGRHEGDGHGHRFERFEAHALTPNFVQERLFHGHGGEAALLENEGVFTREHLGRAIRYAYPSPCEFRSYAREWGWVQSAHVYTRLCDRTVKDSYSGVRERLKAHYANTFGFNIGGKLNEYKGLKAEAPQIVAEAQSFRGGSPLDCGVIDDVPTLAGLAEMETSITLRERVKRYGLMTLLANGDMTWLDRPEFEHIAKDYDAWPLPFASDEVAGWFRLHGFLSTRRKITVRIEENISDWAANELGVAQVISGVTLDVEPNVDWINDLNRHLRRRKFVVLLCLCQPSDLSYQLHLPPMFEVYPFLSRDKMEGSIAIGRDALMLQVAITERRFTCGGGAMFS